MLNIGLSELVIIFFIAYIVVGPKDFPKVVRYCAKKIRKIRGFIDDLKAESGWNDMMDEIEDVKGESAKSIEEVKTDMVKSIEEIKSETAKAVEDTNNEMN